jgi:hypothetical protein
MHCELFNYFVRPHPKGGVTLTGPLIPISIALRQRVQRGKLRPSRRADDRRACGSFSIAAGTLIFASGPSRSRVQGRDLDANRQRALVSPER